MAFNFSALTGALQSEVFMGVQVPDPSSIADVFVPGVILFIHFNSYVFMSVIAFILYFLVGVTLIS